MAELRLIGDIRERPDGAFDGWCWAPDRPNERLVVDLLAGNHVVASMVAAIYRRDLRERGYGDGRHGFLIRLPPDAPGTSRDNLITARERGSGIVFGRILRTLRPVGDPYAERLAPLEYELSEIWGRLAQIRERLTIDAEVATLRTQFIAISGRMQQCPPDMLRRKQLIRIPEIDSPRLTVAFAPTDLPSALARTRSLAPALPCIGAELVVIDAARQLAISTLPAHVSNLRVIRDPAGATFAGALMLAGRMSRARRLVWLHNDCDTDGSAAALLALAAQLQGASLGFWLGSAAGVHLSPSSAPAEVKLPGRLGMLLGVDLELLTQILPPPPDIADSPTLAAADLALKAALLGYRVHNVAEPWPSGLAPAAPDAIEAPASARTAFVARWGRNASASG